MTFETMIDLETLGHKSNAYIIAIGAVNFSIEKGIINEFYTSIEMVPDDRFSIDAQTVSFWLQQSEEARKVLFKDPVDIALALVMFKQFVTGTQGVWGNGATFDNVILREAYNRLNVPCPWHFRKDKCYRTVIGTCPKIELERIGEHHNALDDAKTQALHLIKLHKLYNIFKR